MKNVLIFAGLAGLAAAVAIYFTTENLKDTASDEQDIADGTSNRLNQNMQRVPGSTRKPFHSMS
jgi:hypothetical protein